MIKKRIKMIFYFLMIYIIKGDTINLNLKIDNISFWKENKIFVEKCTKNMIKENICAYLEEDVIKIGDKYLQQFESEEYDTYIIELNLEGKILKIPYIKRKKGMSVENLIGFTRMKKCNKEKKRCEFAKDINKSDGLYSSCKICNAKQIHGKNSR